MTYERQAAPTTHSLMASIAARVETVTATFDTTPDMKRTMAEMIQQANEQGLCCFRKSARVYDVHHTTITFEARDHGSR